MLQITVPDAPSEKDRDAVLAVLRDYNVAQAGDPKLRPVAILLKDEAGADAGGLWGKIAYDWLFVEFLAISPNHRGQDYGTRLMQQAEQIARDAGCLGIWLDTYEFQARGFYEKLGFTVFGTIEDHPKGTRRYFLQKRV
ncbi:GNAT family N-acetyltransferase [Rhizomicrobium palustre]